MILEAIAAIAVTSVIPAYTDVRMISVVAVGVMLAWRSAAILT
jgi:hypothetical protein